MNVLFTLSDFSTILGWPDIPKQYIALAEWLICVTFVLVYCRFAGRNKLALGALKLAMSLIALAIAQVVTGNDNIALILLGTVAGILIMTATIHFCAGMTWRSSAYICARAFIYSEFIASLEWQLYYYFFANAEEENKIFSVVFCLTVYCLCCAVIFTFERMVGNRGNSGKRQFSVSATQLSGVWVIAAFIFVLGNLSFVFTDTPFSALGIAAVFNNIRTMVDLAGVFILAFFHMLKSDNDRKTEIAAIENILSAQYAQYKESQKNIDLINRKYHDLKHQLQIIREEKDDGKKEEYLDEIERGIDSLGTEIKTENPVLDTILTSKSGLCAKFGIAFTVIADGTLLNGIDAMDLCSIFGNALDNAIEYESQVGEKEKRKILVRVMRLGNFNCVLVENYYEGKADFGEELPVTTKSDKQNHGYGLKSIRYSVEKYGGYMNAGVRDEWFRVKIMFPQA